MKSKVLVILQCLSFLVSGGLAHDACSSENRTIDKQACLDAIADRFVDTDLFWFGDSYETLCPPQLRYTTIECGSFLQGSGYSISSLIFKDVVNGTANLKTYLDVTYHSPAGNYEACSSTFETPETEFTLHPLSDEKRLPSLSRYMPEVSYEYTPSKQYTLLILDVASTPVHGLYLNIPGDDIDSDLVTVIKSYNGPQNARARGNVYVFLLFEQETKDLRLNDTFIATIMTPFNPSKDWNQIFHDMQLTGPIGINWLYADYDPYSVELQYIGFNGLMNCCPFVQKALMSHNQSFIPDSTSLSVFTKVGIHNEQMSFDYCCKTTTYTEKVVLADPFSDELVLAGEVRTGNSVKISAIMNKPFPNITADFVGKKYTVILVDPDVPIPQAGTKERPLLHMAGINADVVDGEFRFGSVLADYIGPLPGSGVHTYYFITFEQLGGELNLNDTSEYTVVCIERLRNRCLFDVEKFTSENELLLVGASWMLVGNDNYVNFASGIAQEDACKDAPGYSNPCMTPVSSAVKTNNFNYVWFAFIVVVFSLKQKL